MLRGAVYGAGGYRVEVRCCGGLYMVRGAIEWR